MKRQSAKKTPAESPEQQAAMLRHQLHAYRDTKEFLEQYGTMDARLLHETADRCAVLSSKLRALAWRRQDAIITNN